MGAKSENHGSKLGKLVVKRIVVGNGDQKGIWNAGRYARQVGIRMANNRDARTG